MRRQTARPRTPRTTAMHHIEVDPAKNRLLIRIWGSSTVEDVKKAEKSLMEALAKLKPGFDCISNIVDMKASAPQVAEEFARVQALVIKAGIGRGVRVVGSKLAAMQFARTTGSRATEVATENDAHALLDRAG